MSSEIAEIQAGSPVTRITYTPTSGRRGIVQSINGGQARVRWYRDGVGRVVDLTNDTALCLLRLDTEAELLEHSQRTIIPTVEEHPPGCICRKCCKVGEHAPARSRVESDPDVPHSLAFIRQPEACQYIVALANTFPTMAGRFRPETWDIDNFMYSLGTASHGEAHVMLFIANVWNPNGAEGKGWRFDFFKAIGRMDGSHRRALMAWMSNPRFP